MSANLVVRGERVVTPAACAARAFTSAVEK